MINKILRLVIIGLLFISCAEKEDPETIFGLYLPESITSDKAMDFTGNGIVSLDLLDQRIKPTTSEYSQVRIPERFFLTCIAQNILTLIFLKSFLGFPIILNLMIKLQ